ncbi:MAG: cyclic nucleotide-binding domain-containing protein [Myxococcota bacterium]
MEPGTTLEQVIQFLLETPLFQDLDASELAEVVQIMQIQRFRPDQAIFKEGDEGNAWYVIFEGEARVEMRNPFTPTREVALLGPHACFGEMAILDESARSATITAQENITAFRFPAIQFQLLLEEGNLAAYKLIHAMAKTLCLRQRRLNQQLSDLLEENDTDAIGLRSRVGPLLEESSISE